MARAKPRPYIVKVLSPDDVTDWKLYSQQLKILRARQTEEGESVDLDQVLQLRVEKSQQAKPFLKGVFQRFNFFKLTVS